MDARFCARCGTELPPGADFCPKCGAPKGAPVSKKTYLIWVPIAVIGLALLGWAVLSGMPFSREPRRPAERPMEVVTEREEASTQTVAAIGEVERGRPGPPDPPQPLQHEMTETQSAAALRRYIVASGTSSDQCTAISLIEYRNRGYTFEVHDRCDDESLGRWRVDSEDPTGQGIFRQRADGRYLRP